MIKDIVFVIPVRHPASVKNWALVKENLSKTLASISRQDTANWSCRIVASHGTDMPDLPPGCSMRMVDMPPPVLPDPRLGIEAYYDAVRHDKGLRLYEAVHDLPLDTYVMVVDFDDFVSKRIAGFVQSQPDRPGWYIPKGYMYAGGRMAFRMYNFHRKCGTSHIIRRSSFGNLTARDGTPDIAAIKRRLGSHLFLLDEMKQAGTPLEPLPFPGAVYRVGNPESASGRGSLFRTATPFQSFISRPLSAVSRLRNYRLITWRMRKEFGL